MNMIFESLKGEVYRAYEVLGEGGALQNEIDIYAWFVSGLITKPEVKELRLLNRQLFEEYYEA